MNEGYQPWQLMCLLNEAQSIWKGVSLSSDYPKPETLRG